MNDFFYYEGQMLSSYEETDSLDTDMNDDTTPAVEGNS
jgi:hypothetical protein